jgi:type II secretory pathway pseudopilin PulG
MPQESPKSNTVLIVIAIIGVIGTIVASTIGAVGNYNIEKLRQEAELTQIALVSIATQGGATQVSMASTISAPTDTPYPTHTLQPTYTPYPSQTPLPIPTIPPTQSITLPFLDTFDAGLNPAWKVVNGTPLIENAGLRATNGDLYLEIQGNFDPNYAVSFDFIDKDPYYHTGEKLAEVIFSSRLSCQIQSRKGTTWRAFDGNKWFDVSKTELGIYTDPIKFRFVVQGNIYQLYYNNQLVSEIKYGESLSPGSIGIFLNSKAALDNFAITLP